jgi:hypothetical protein
MQAPRERPHGYSTTAPPEAEATARRLRQAVWAEPALLRRLGIRYVVDHRNGVPRNLRVLP